MMSKNIRFKQDKKLDISRFQYKFLSVRMCEKNRKQPKIETYQNPKTSPIPEKKMAIPRFEPVFMA